MTFFRWLIAIVVISSLIAGLGYFKYSKISVAIAQAASYPEHSEVSEAQETSNSSYVPTLSILGDVLNPEHLILRSQRAGPIARLGFRPGEPVKMGQMLVQLDISEDLARLEGAQADVDLARLVVERAQKLRKSGSIAQSKLDLEKANLKKAQSAVEIIESSIAQKTLKAPMAGSTNSGTLTIGQYINIGDQIAEITGTKPTRWLDFSLPQDFFELSEKAKIIVQLTKDAHVPGTLIAIDKSISSTSRTRKYRVSFDIGERDIVHGASLLVQVPSGGEKDVVRLPVAALRSDAYGQYVYVLGPSDQEGAYRAVRQQVSDISYQGDQALIGQGLEAGKLVATNGSFKLYPGVLTRVVDKLPQDKSTKDSW